MLYGVEDLRERIAALAEELDLTEFLDRPTGKLSAGQKTRVALAKALINRPRCCCSTSRPPRSIPTPPTGCAAARALSRSAAPPCCSPRTTWRGRAAVRARHHHEARPHRGRRHAGAAARRATAATRWKKCFLDVARGRGEAREARNERALRAHGAFSPHRVGAMVLRYWYLLRSSWPRLLELIYWPAVQMLMWGFLQNYIAQNSGFFARAGGTLIGAVMLWDILFRGQLGFSISFLEEMWARNLGNLMMSPLRRSSSSPR
jgi:uncharacterized small protein (DUF1192 family)